jgi:hypothetical protein
MNYQLLETAREPAFRFDEATFKSIRPEVNENSKRSSKNRDSTTKFA